jgi:hypothetical protein
MQVASVVAETFTTRHGNDAVMLSQNYFLEPNQHVSTFLHPILLCTAGDALGEGGDSKESFGELVSELQCYKIGAT